MGARHYDEEDVERGLTEVARCRGNASRAERRLAERGIKISRRTLGVWAHEKHRDRYRRITQEVLPEIQARLAAELEDLLEAEIQAERETLERYRESIGELEPRDLSAALRNVAVSKGIAADKAAQLREPPLEEPPATVAGFEELLNKIERLGGAAIKRVSTVEAKAVELPSGDPPHSPDKSPDAEG
jgi:hypothetical protein